MNDQQIQHAKNSLTVFMDALIITTGQVENDSLTDAYNELHNVLVNALVKFTEHDSLEFLNDMVHEQLSAQPKGVWVHDPAIDRLVCSECRYIYCECGEYHPNDH